MNVHTTSFMSNTLATAIARNQCGPQVLQIEEGMARKSRQPVESPPIDAHPKQNSTAAKGAGEVSAPSGVNGSGPQEGALSRALEKLLIEQAKQDPNAFGTLYEHYVDRIYAYIYNRVGNAQDTEDLTARTFYQALTKLPDYEDRGAPFSAWLYRIAHNLVANWHRDRSRRHFVPLEGLKIPLLDRSKPEETVEKAEEIHELWQAIQRLPSDRQQLLVYKFGKRLSNLEIGRLMNRSEGAIKSLYFRTLAALRKELSSQDEPEPGRADSNGASPQEPEQLQESPSR